MVRHRAAAGVDQRLKPVDRVGGWGELQRGVALHADAADHVFRPADRVSRIANNGPRGGPYEVG